MCALLIIAALGSIPERGTIIPVPVARYWGLTSAERATAKRCARAYGLRWRIVR